HYALAPNYENGKFVNQTPTDMHMDLSTIVSVLRDQIKGISNSRPEKPIPVVPIDSLHIQEDRTNSLIWFGHSSFLLRLDSLNIIVDPMFGDSPAPNPMLGGKRFDYDSPLTPESLP